MEDCTSREEAEEKDKGGDVIRISRAGLDYILRAAGGVGMTAGVEAGLQIDEFNVVTIERSELARILQEQGGTPFSDAQWTRLTSVYPPAEHNGDQDGDVLRSPGWLAFVASHVQAARDMLSESICTFLDRPPAGEGSGGKRARYC